MEKFTFDDIKEVSFYKAGDEIKARVLFERNLNVPDLPPINLTIGFPDDYPYGRENMNDSKLKTALKNWLEAVVIPAINTHYGLEE